MLRALISLLPSGSSCCLSAREHLYGSGQNRRLFFEVCVEAIFQVSVELLFNFLEVQSLYLARHPDASALGQLRGRAVTTSYQRRLDLEGFLLSAVPTLVSAKVLADIVRPTLPPTVSRSP